MSSVVEEGAWSSSDHKKQVDACIFTKADGEFS